MLIFEAVRTNFHQWIKHIKSQPQAELGMFT